MKTHNPAARAALEDFKRRIKNDLDEAFGRGLAAGFVVGLFFALLLVSSLVSLVTP